MEMREMNREESVKVAKAGKVLTVVGCITEIFALPFIIAIVRGFTLQKPGTVATGIVFFLFFSGITGVIVYFGSRFRTDAREGMAAVERGPNQSEPHTWIGPHSRNGPQIRINDKTFNVTWDMFEFASKGGEYEVHYAPKSRFILEVRNSKGESVTAP